MDITDQLGAGEGQVVQRVERPQPVEPPRGSPQVNLVASSVANEQGDIRADYALLYDQLDSSFYRAGRLLTQRSDVMHTVVHTEGETTGILKRIHKIEGGD